MTSKEFRETVSNRRSMPKIDLTRLKDITEEEWKELVCYIPFTNNCGRAFRDYTDNCSLGKHTYVFQPRNFKTAKEAGMTMLRTLNFMNK